MRFARLGRRAEGDRGRPTTRRKRPRRRSRSTADVSFALGAESAPAEVHAERAAKAAVDDRSTRSSAVLSSSGTVERAQELDHGAALAISSSRRFGGMPLPGRRRFEQFFKVPLTGVKVHTGTAADAVNRRLDAKAATAGQDIFLSTPVTRSYAADAARVLAHEVAHAARGSRCAPTCRRRHAPCSVRATCEARFCSPGPASRASMRRTPA